MMMNYFRITLLLFSTLTFAQEKVSDTIALQTKVVDTLATQTASLDTLNIDTNHNLTVESDSIVKDSLPLILEKLKASIKGHSEYQYAKSIDSLWLKELYNNDLYDSINHIRKNIKADTIY